VDQRMVGRCHSSLAFSDIYKAMKSPMRSAGSSYPEMSKRVTVPDAAYDRAVISTHHQTLPCL
jgi:hypothetical protein